MSFLLSEDEALRNLLQNMTVTDQNANESTTRTVQTRSRATNVATLTTKTNHNYSVGQSVIVSGVETTFNGTFTITAVPTLRSFSYANPGSTVSSTASSGTTTTGTARKVGVWFGQPDQELRDQKYPYITIDMIDIAEDFSRAMRGKVKPSYIDDPGTIGTNTEFDDDLHSWKIDYPIPVNIDYQITTYSRQPRHDRQIMAQLLYTKIPLRFAVLHTNDNTVRRLDVLDISKRDVSENGKRLFVNAITVRISSEIAPVLFEKYYKVLELGIQGVSDQDGNSLMSVIGRGEYVPIDDITITAP